MVLVSQANPPIVPFMTTIQGVIFYLIFFSLSPNRFNFIKAKMYPQLMMWPLWVTAWQSSGRRHSLWVRATPHSSTAPPSHPYMVTSGAKNPRWRGPKSQILGFKTGVHKPNQWVTSWWLTYIYSLWFVSITFSSLVDIGCFDMLKSMF